MKPLLKLTSIAFLIIILFSNCKDESPVICDPTPQFDIDEFVMQIETRMETSPIVGYQYAIYQNDDLYHDDFFGQARHDNDPGGPIDIDANTRFNTASIAKFVAAVVLVDLLEERNISLDLDFIDYLPVSWHDTAHWQHQYTFRELLLHQTEIDFLQGRTQTEAEMLAALVAPPDPNNIGYQNGNFCLIRVLIGELVYNLDERSPTYATDCTDRYFEYISQKVFNPLGINCPKSANDIITYYNTNTYPYAYQYPFDTSYMNPADGTLGWPHEHNVYRTGGAAGLMLSALDIGKITRAFKSAQIVSPIRRDIILQDELGLNNSISGTNGRYQCKRGTRGPDPNGGNRAVQSILMFFPNGVEAIIITNSRHNTLHTLLRDAYDASWINPC